MSDSQERRESNPKAEDPKVEAEELNTEQDVDKNENVQVVQDSMDLQEESDEGSTSDSSEEDDSNLFAPRENVTELEIKKQDPPTSTKHTVSKKYKKEQKEMKEKKDKKEKKEKKEKKAKKESPIKAVYSTTSSKTSKAKKDITRSKTSVSSKPKTKSTKHKKVKEAPTKAADESGHGSKMIYSIFNKKHSDVSVGSSLKSSLKSSSLSRSSRLSRVSLSFQLSEDSSEDIVPGVLRKAKRSSAMIKDAEELIKEEDPLHADFPSELSLTDSQELEVEQEIVPDAPMTLRYKMLEMLKDLPDIDQLSATSLHSFTRIQFTEETETKSANEGKFVEAVSQFDEIPETQTIEPSVYDYEYEGHEEDITESSSWSRSLGSDDTLMNLPSLSSLESQSDLFKPPEPLERPPSFSRDIIQKMTEVRVRGSQVEFTEAENREQRRITTAICYQFVEDVIGRVVIMCEEASVRFKRLLDKEKMWHSLKSLMDQLTDEYVMHDKLEKAATEHFLRKKRYVFIKTSKHFDSINFSRLRSALIEYDRNLEIEEETNKKVQARIADLKQELHEQQISSDEKLKEIEQIIRQTLLQNDNFDHLKSAVANAIKNMSKVRNEVSDMRRELLYTQHRFADMINRSEALEDLGYGLKMREYLTRQADTQALLIKIQERNDELKRLHMKVNCDVHALAHVGCKQQMSRRTNNRMKTKLIEFTESKNELREQIYQGKLRHNAIIREINKLKSDGSLLHYPVLLKDFDNTTDTMRARRDSIEKLRIVHKNLVQRIKAAEQMLESRKKVARSSKTKRKLPNIKASVVVTPLRLS